MTFHPVRLFIRRVAVPLLLPLLALPMLCRVAGAEGKSLIEVSTATDSYSGRLVAMDGGNCWLFERDGRLNTLDVNALKKFKRVSNKFEPFSSIDLKNRLRDEFGSGYEIVQSGRYMVVAAKGRGKEFANVLDDVYGIVQREFRVRGFKISAPEFPMVAVVFPQKSAYLEYAENEGAKGVSVALGYYKRESNRIAIYEEDTQSRGPSQGKRKQLTLGQNGIGPLNVRATRSVFQAIETNLRDTLIHEAVHQVAFNLKIHSRIGNDPRWVIEGLATLFEAPGVRNRASKYDFATRINRERYVTFGNFAQDRRKDKSLRDFVSSDRQFSSSVLDGYAQAWALTFFLFETRGSDYAKYMKLIAARDVLKDYDAAARIAHFEEAFGDVDAVEISFLRYMKRMKI